jgi:YidC/Oxa1 family membrane protein insertase
VPALRRAATVTGEIANRFAPLAPGVKTPYEALNYLRSQDRVRALSENIDKLKAQLNDVQNRLSNTSVPAGKAALAVKENYLKNSISSLERQYSLIMPEVRNGVKTTESLVEIDTDVFKGVFSTKGAVFKTLIYKNLKTWDPSLKKHVPMNALNADPSLRNSQVAPFLVSFNPEGISEQNIPVYTYNEAKSKELSKNGTVAKVFYIRYYKKGSIFRLEKHFLFNKSGYAFDFKIKIVNEYQVPGGYDIEATDGASQDGYYLFWGQGLGEFIPKNIRSNYDEEIRFSYYSTAEAKLLEEEKKKDLNKRIYPNQASWVGLDNRYFFVGFDFKKNNDTASLRNNPQNYNRVNYALLKRKTRDYRETIVLSFEKFKFSAVNQSRESSLKVYLGPKNKSYLSELKNNMELVAERGWLIFQVIGRGIQLLLMEINKLIKNFGISIIILTIIIKLLLHPLNKKSTESAKKMQLIQPKVQELNKQYAKDPQLKQRKLMELYKKEGINPLGGCLPLVLQMPFFFALFQTLPYIVELKDVSFLWIRDLSSPDTILNINLYITDQLNILPLIMTATSIWQSILQKTDGGDQKQQRMMMFLPVVFLFIFYKMPSGLVLYWTVQNLLQIVMQYFANKKVEKQKALELAAKEVKTTRRSGKN